VDGHGGAGLNIFVEEEIDKEILSVEPAGLIWLSWIA